MKKLKRKRICFLLFAILASVVFVASIVMLPIAATNDITAVLICSIVFLAVSFYAIPLLWLSFANLSPLYKTLVAIEDYHILDVATLASTLQVSQSEIISRIKKLISKFYLTDYTFENNILIQKFEQPLQDIKSNATSKCPACGALMQDFGDKFVCPYCGTIKKI